MWLYYLAHSCYSKRNLLLIFYLSFGSFNYHMLVSKIQIILKLWSQYLVSFFSLWFQLTASILECPKDQIGRHTERKDPLLVWCLLHACVSTHTTRLLPQGNWFTMGKFAWIHLWLICLGFNPIKTTLVTGVRVNNLQDTNNSKTFLACKSNHTHACNSMTSYIFYLFQFNLLLIFFNKHSDQELFFYNVWLSACTMSIVIFSWIA